MYLLKSISPLDTTIYLSDTFPLGDDGTLIIGGDEEVSYTGKTDNSVLEVVRGVDSQARSHSAGAHVIIPGELGTDVPVKATGAEVNTGTNDTKFATPKAIEDSDYVKTSAVPVKATGAELNTGTNDAKFATPKALADSNYLSGAQQTHIADPSAGSTIDAQSRTAIASILDALEAVGILATS